MITKQITVLEAENNMVLTDGEHYCSSVMLRFDETPDKWSEITKEEYEEYIGAQEEDIKDDETNRSN